MTLYVPEGSNLLPTVKSNGMLAWTARFCADALPTVTRAARKIVSAVIRFMSFTPFHFMKGPYDCLHLMKRNSEAKGAIPAVFLEGKDSDPRLYRCST